MACRVVILLALALALGEPARAEPNVLAASYPEGPLWRGERLYFAEMGADRITVRDADGARPFFVQEGCGPTAIAPYGEGFLVLCHRGMRVAFVDKKGRELRRWDRDDAGKPLTNPNDAAADGRGGVYFSDPGPFSEASRTAPRGRIMYLSAGGALTSVAGPLAYPNGVTVKDGSLYVSEHLRGRILRYPIEADGRLGATSVFADLSWRRPAERYASPYALSGPDGLEFGPDSALYVALYGEGRLIKLSATGEIIGVFDVPTRFLTNIAFGKNTSTTTGTFDNRDRALRGEVRIGEGVPASIEPAAHP